MEKKYDVVVIGAGHAGLEAAFAAAKQKLKVALVTLDEKSIGMTPCNPSIGGPAKGIVTREIDALGGMQAIATDENQLQMKLLNTSKGPGVWALRAQIDKVTYHQWFVKKLSKNKYIDLIIDEVKKIDTINKMVSSISLTNNKIIETKYIVITTGTYMDSLTFRGDDVKDEGPDDLKNSKGLSENLKDLGFDLIRLKTGTPPRILSSSIDYTGLKEEPGTDKKMSFSHFNKIYLPFNKQMICHIIHTNEETHKIISENIKLSAMYGGMINGTGPRYCPSIEDKIVKFADKPRHQIFIEPESRFLNTIYLGGFSSSMPVDVQDRMIRTLPGLKNCKIDKYAYAIEYDAIDPLQLKKTLESKKIKNLYFAGQINGTSGYEEAASQGLIASLNICNDYFGREPLILGRDEAYIGVMIDDITTRGITEPYRLLTSRAEYRLLLRNDNADDRLLKIGYENNMISKDNYNEYLENSETINEIIGKLKLKTIGMIPSLSKDSKKTNLSLYDFLKRPETKIDDILSFVYSGKELGDELKMKIEIQVKFDGYIKKQNDDLLKMNKLDKFKLNNIIDYNNIPNLSLEAIDKLNKILPYDLDQASRISGINITDIICIKYFLEKNTNE